MSKYMDYDGNWTDPNSGQTYTSGPTGSAQFDPHAGTCPDGGVTNVNYYNPTVTSFPAPFDWNKFNPIWPNKPAVTDTRDIEIVALRAQVQSLQNLVARIRNIANNG